MNFCGYEKEGSLGQCEKTAGLQIEGIYYQKTNTYEKRLGNTTQCIRLQGETEFVDEQPVPREEHALC